MAEERANSVVGATKRSSCHFTPGSSATLTQGLLQACPSLVPGAWR